VFASVSIVAGTALVTRLIGFFRMVSLATFYGAGVVSDSFIIAFTTPEIILSLIASSFASAYIPAYTYVKHKDTKLLFTSNIINILTCIGFLFAVVFTIIPQSLTYAFASQFEPERFKLTTEMLRIIVWSSMPILLIGILQGYLQIYKAFFIATVATIPINVFIIFFIWLSHISNIVILLAIGVIIGNAAALILLFIFVKRKGYEYTPYINLRMPEFRNMMLLVAPIMLSNLIGELNQVIDRNFASILITGSVSSLNYAGKLVGTIVLIISGSVMTVIFPNLSELAALNDIEKLKNHISITFKRTIPLLLPATLGIIILARPIIRFMFEHGNFTAEDTVRTSECLQVYAVLIITLGLSGVLSRAFFALSDTRMPAIISSVSIMLNITLNTLFVEKLAHIGLTIATVISSLLSFILLLVVFKKKYGSLQLFNNPQELLKSVVALFIMGVIIYLGKIIFPVMSDKFIISFSSTVGLIIIGIFSYAFIHYVLRTELYKEGHRIFRKFLKLKQ
jgi:putative peptidoglycan lipid II flippase